MMAVGVYEAAGHFLWGDFFCCAANKQERQMEPHILNPVHRDYILPPSTRLTHYNILSLVLALSTIIKINNKIPAGTVQPEVTLELEDASLCALTKD